MEIKAGDKFDTLDKRLSDEVRQFIKFNMDKFKYHAPSDRIVYIGPDIEL